MNYVQINYKKKDFCKIKKFKVCNCLLIELFFYLKLLTELKKT